MSDIFTALSAHNALVGDYEPIDKQAMWITPVKGTTASDLEAAISATLDSHGWIATSHKQGRVLIEPTETRPIGIEPPGCVLM